MHWYMDANKINEILHFAKAIDSFRDLFLDHVTKNWENWLPFSGSANVTPDRNFLSVYLRANVRGALTTGTFWEDTALELNQQNHQSNPFQPSDLSFFADLFELGDMICKTILVLGFQAV